MFSSHPTQQETEGRIQKTLSEIESEISSLYSKIPSSSDEESISVWTQKVNVLTAAKACLSREEVTLEDIDDVIHKNPCYTYRWSMMYGWYSAPSCTTRKLVDEAKNIAAVLKSSVMKDSEILPVSQEDAEKDQGKQSCSADNGSVSVDEHIFHSICPTAMPAAGIPENQTNAIMGKFSSSCRRLHTLFSKELSEKKLKALKELSLAVIDENVETIQRILGAFPALLLTEPEKLEIESQCTWQRFHAENPLTMAVKRKQLNMIELLLPYYDHIGDQEAAMAAKAASLSAWKFYTIQKNYQSGEDEIVIPKAYSDYINSLIEKFAADTVANVEDDTLSGETEKALTELFNTLLPEKAVKLDDYWDIELLLLAAYKGYVEGFDVFQHWEQRDKFCIRVIGLIQGCLAPETAKIFCEGLDAVVTAIGQNRKPAISERALKHLLKDNSPFYRLHRSSISGLGFFFLCGIFGVPGRRSGACVGQEDDRWITKLCQAKAAGFWNVMLRSQPQPDQRPAEQGNRPSGCVIY